MGVNRVQPMHAVGESAVAAGGTLDRYVGHVPIAFAVTRGDGHALVYANSAFRSLFSANGDLVIGRPLADAITRGGPTGLATLLDRSFRTGAVSRNRHIGPVEERMPPMTCTVWPDVNGHGESEFLVIELRAATQAELTLKLQREVAERLLLGALQSQDAALAAVVSQREAAFLAAESGRLSASLDEVSTLAAMERMALPHAGAWCIVDIFDESGAMHRLTVIHPDPLKQTILQGLDGHWVPHVDDPFGLPAILRRGTSVAIIDDVEAALANAAHDEDTFLALRELGAGPLLTVPLVIREKFIGAVTFVSGRHGQPFTAEETALAEELASRSAMALDRARVHGEALSLRAVAESASNAKSAFLGMMSHELRTPLNAIGGYVDLIDLGIHGPVTEQQHASLGRIRTNQRHLMGLINDLLNLTKLGGGRMVYDIREWSAHGLLSAAIALVEPLVGERNLTIELLPCDENVHVHADREKAIQVLVNVLGNGIKFTPKGGSLIVDCVPARDTVMLRVSDTGIGIPVDKLDSIFDPFVQVKGNLMGSEGGVGLGLSISRSLVRAMHGDLTVESTLGEGARFTVTLPRSAGAGQPG